MTPLVLLVPVCSLMIGLSTPCVHAAPVQGRGVPNVARIDRGVEFVENRGQWPARVRHLCRTGAALAWIEERGVTLDLRAQEAEPSLQGVVVHLSFEDSSEHCVVEGIERRRGIFNFFIGNDPSLWLTNVTTYGAVRYRGVQPGIDLVLRPLEDGSFKYDVHVAPGADLSRLVVRCRGIERLELEDDGDLSIATALGALEHPRGVSWQEEASGERREVECRLRIVDERSFGFEVPERDPSLALVIDPGLVWSTYIGSPGGTVGDLADAAAVGPDGDVYVVGQSSGPAFPMTPGTYQHPGPGATNDEDVFVARLSGTDGSLVYSSVIGGTQDAERGQAVAVDAEGRATVTGFTFSKNFPSTPGAFDPVMDPGNGSAFVLRLSAMGDQLLYSTFLQDTGLESSEGEAVAIDPVTGSAVVGGTATANFPTTAGAWDETYNGGGDGFVARLDPSGSTLEWSTYFGGTGIDEIHGLALDAQGNVTVTGETRSLDLPTTPGAFDTTLGAGQPSPSQVNRNAFVARIDVSGSSLLWSTYLGGEITGLRDVGRGVAADPSGGVFVTGNGSLDFPTTPGAYQASPGPGGGFVTRFAADGTLLCSTNVAGPGSDHLVNIAVDGSGMPTVAGFADGGFPTTPGCLSPSYNGGALDTIVARLDPSLSKLVYSTYFGGSTGDGASGMAMSPRGRVTVVGESSGLTPTTPGSHSPTYNGGQTDAFVATLDLYLQGVEPHGDPTPACRGPLLANATEMPAAGASGFALYCSGSPPLSTGLLLLGRLRQAPVRRLGVDVWIDLSLPTRIIPVTSDADGYIEARWPLTSATPGAVFSAQFIMRTTLSCPGTGPRCASDAVRVTVQ